jgi:hypothetical protein
LVAGDDLLPLVVEACSLPPSEDFLLVGERCSAVPARPDMPDAAAPVVVADGLVSLEALASSAVDDPPGVSAADVDPEPRPGVSALATPDPLVSAAPTPRATAPAKSQA